VSDSACALVRPAAAEPIPSTERDATYVLDEILDNETDVPIDQHTTDTAGYSELIFSLFDQVGLQFSPRIRDMADQRLYRLDRSVRYEHIEALFSGILNQDLSCGAGMICCG
jgi:TnpA family transposase